MEPSPVLTPVSLRGFTLIEMLVVLAIIVLITAIAISGQGNFNQSLIVTDTAYTVALSIREAQTFGLSSRDYSGTNNAGYGVHFNSATPTSYLIFASISNGSGVPAWCPVGTPGHPDAKVGNCLYNGNGVVQTYTFSRGFSITSICGHAFGGGPLRCSGGGSIAGIDMFFTRPNTDSIITGLRTGSPNIQLNDAQITISAPTGGGVRYVCLTSVGEVSVSATACP